MDAWSLPTSLNVAGKEYPIRSDYRVVLDILQCMNDPEIFEPDMTEDEKRAEQVISMLAILYIDFDDMPPGEWEEASEKAYGCWLFSRFRLDRVPSIGRLPAGVSGQRVPGR